MKLSKAYARQVFLNCPFDDEYRPIYEAIIFAVIHCGFVIRCARERDDSGETRISKIVEIIRASQFGIHDISRVELDKSNGLPRFNMPLELGLFLGAKFCPVNYPAKTSNPNGIVHPYSNGVLQGGGHYFFDRII